MLDWFREHWKKILAIIGFIAIVLFLAWLIWLLFFGGGKKEAVQPVAPETPVITGFPQSTGEYAPTPREKPISGTPPSVITKEIQPPETAEEAKGGPVQVVNIDTGYNTAMRLDRDGKGIVAFDRFTGTFSRLTPSGEKTPLSKQTFDGAQYIAWAPTADKAVIQFPDGSNIFYDFPNEKQVTLPSHWFDANFSPSGDKISFKSIGEDPANRWFAIGNPDGTNTQVLEELGTKAGLFIPSWSPSGQVAGLFHEGFSHDRQKLYFIGTRGENFKSTVVAGNGLETQWSPSGDRLLHSVYSEASGYKPELWIVDALGDAIGQNRRRLRLNTWAHKCAFADNDIVYCGVPTELINGAGLAPALGDTAEDHIWKVNLATGERIKVAEPPESTTIGSLKVATDESVLYFTDKVTGQIYRMKLE